MKTLRIVSKKHENLANSLEYSLEHSLEHSLQQFQTTFTFDDIS
jgi:hypothetical protein